MKNDVHPDDPLHIERCATCREQMMNSSDFARSVADVEQSIAAGPESGHLDYETELAPYVDGQLGGAERDIVERHLASCNQCAAEARDLREFRSVLENESRFSKRLLPWLAAAAALLVLIGIGWWRELPGRREQVQKEIPRQETSPRSPALVALHDESRTIVLQSDGTVRGLPVTDRHSEQLVTEALRNRTLKVPSSPEFRRGKETLLGTSRNRVNITLLDPVNIAVAEDRPAFRWTGPANARYEVEIYDPDFRRVTASPQLRATSWTADRALKRSALYSWQLVAHIDSREVTVPEPPSAPARFKVISGSEAAAIAQARAIEPPSHLLLAVLYANGGLRREAEAEIRKLADQNPQSTIPADLLHSIRTPPFE